MDITWLGYGCFRLKGRNVTVVTDPFDRSIAPTPNTVSADIVTISSPDPAFSNLGMLSRDVQAITGPGEYEIANTMIVGVQTYRDQQQGQERGKNTAYAIEVDDIVIGHLGSLGHVLNDEQVEALGSINVLLVPVGGHGALDAAMAAEVVSMIEPSVVIPMMFAVEGLQVTADPVDRFLKEMGVTSFEPQAKLSVTRSGLPEDIKVVVLDPKAS